MYDLQFYGLFTMKMYDGDGRKKLENKKKWTK